MQPAYFSTDDFAEPDRFEAWRTRGWPSLAPIFDARPTSSSFHASIHTYQFGAVAMSAARMSGQELERSQRKIRADGLDHLGVLLMLEGEHRGVAGEGVSCGGDMTIQLGDFSKTYLQRSSPSQSITLAIPRAMAEPVLGPIGRLHGAVLDAGRAGLLIDHIRAMRRRAATLGPAAGEHLGLSVLHLMAAALRVETPVAEDGRAALRQAARLRAEREIERRLSEPGLNAETLAEGLGMSRSALYRLFVEDNGVAAAIGQARLARARDLLADPSEAFRISQVGYACGFASPAQFTRAFQRAFRMSPSEFRASLSPGA